MPQLRRLSPWQETWAAVSLSDTLPLSPAGMGGTPSFSFGTEVPPTNLVAT